MKSLTVALALFAASSGMAQDRLDSVLYCGDQSGLLPGASIYMNQLNQESPERKPWYKDYPLGISFAVRVARPWVEPSADIRGWLGMFRREGSSLIFDQRGSGTDSLVVDLNSAREVEVPVIKRSGKKVGTIKQTHYCATYKTDQKTFQWDAPLCDCYFPDVSYSSKEVEEVIKSSAVLSPAIPPRR